MAITLNDNIYNYSPKSLDAKYTKLVGVVATPFASVAEANTTLISAYRSIGQTVLIADGGVNKEYWYRAGLLDADLVLKTIDTVFTLSLAAVGSTPNANGATLTGTVLNLEPANATNPGVLTAAGVQSIGGEKSFNGRVSFLSTDGTYFSAASITANRPTLFASDPYFRYNTNLAHFEAGSTALGGWKTVAWTTDVPTFTASNGLTKSANDFRLGGTLANNTTINTAGFRMFISGASTSDIFRVSATSGAGAINGNSVDGIGVFGTSSTAEGVAGSSVSSSGVSALSRTGIPLYAQKELQAVNNIIGTVLNLETVSNLSTGAIGIGVAIQFRTVMSNGFVHPIGYITSILTDATEGTRKSKMVFTNTHNGTLTDALTLNSTGEGILHKYGVGSFTGTPIASLKVTSSGNIIEGFDDAPISTISSGSTAVADNIYLCDTTSAGFTMTVNPATLFTTARTRKIIFKKITNDVNTITITPSTGIIDGAASFVIDTYNQSITVVSDGTNLYIL